MKDYTFSGDEITTKSSPLIKTLQYGYVPKDPYAPPLRGLKYYGFNSVSKDGQPLPTIICSPDISKEENLKTLTAFFDTFPDHSDAKYEMLARCKEDLASCLGGKEALAAFIDSREDLTRELFDRFIPTEKFVSDVGVAKNDRRASKQYEDEL